MHRQNKKQALAIRFSNRDGWPNASTDRILAKAPCASIVTA
jgi:hypothetical protein